MSLNSCSGNQTKYFLSTFDFLRLSGVSLIPYKFDVYTAKVVKILGVEIPPSPLGIKCGYEIAWYKKDQRNWIFVISLINFLTIFGILSKTNHISYG